MNYKFMFVFWFCVNVFICFVGSKKMVVFLFGVVKEERGYLGWYYFLIKFCFIILILCLFIRVFV